MAHNATLQQYNNCKGYTTLNDMRGCSCSVHFKGLGKKWPWPISRDYPRLCMEKVKSQNTQDSWYPGLDLNQEVQNKSQICYCFSQFVK